MADCDCDCGRVRASKENTKTQTDTHGVRRTTSVTSLLHWIMHFSTACGPVWLAMAATMLWTQLPVELVHAIAFETTLDAIDVRNLSLASHATFTALFGDVHAPNPYDVNQHRALAGIAFCCQHGWWRAARLAVERGYGDPNKEWSQLYAFSTTPVQQAIHNNQVELLKALLAHPDVAMGCCVSLAQPCRAGNTDVVRFLLDNGYAEPDEDDSEAILLAASGNHVDLLALLLEDGRADPGAGDNGALMSAAESGHIESVRLLLADPRVDPSDIDDYALWKASETGHVEIVRLLLADPRVDPLVDDSFPLAIAAENGHLDVVRLLLEDGRSDPGGDDNYALRQASHNGHADVVALLLSDPRTDPTAGNNYAFRTATALNHTTILDLLLDPKHNHKPQP